MSNIITINVDLSAKTCSCGSVYAVPYWLTGYTCPMCSERKIQTIRNEKNELRLDNERLGRVIIGLRGALTKKKKKEVVK